MTDQERMLKILDDTIEWFRTNPRATVEVMGGETCVYSLRARLKHPANTSPSPRHFTDESPDQRCAVGRYISDAALVTCGGFMGSVTDLEVEFGLDKLLVPEVQGLSMQFWYDVQELHDLKTYWAHPVGGNLTVTGHRVANYIRQKITDGVYDG